jgi:hypothetical protein
MTRIDTTHAPDGRSRESLAISKFNQGNLMKHTSQNPKRHVTCLALVAALAASAMAPVHAYRGESPFGPSGLSILPLASVASVAVVGAGASAAAVALPVALTVSGATLIVKSVEVSARGTLCVLERASDGAVATLEFSGRSAQLASLAVGRTVEVSAVGAGVVLSAMGGVIAFLPNELGRALLHNERLTD